MPLPPNRQGLGCCVVIVYWPYCHLEPVHTAELCATARNMLFSKVRPSLYPQRETFLYFIRLGWCILLITSWLWIASALFITSEDILDGNICRPVLQAEHPEPSTHSSLDLAVLSHPIFLINTQNRLQCAKVSEPHTMSQEWSEECRAQQLSIQLYIHIGFGKANANCDSFEAYC